MRKRFTSGAVFLGIVLALVRQVARSSERPEDGRSGARQLRELPPLPTNTQRSPDRRIALAAVIVTGIVGVTAPVIAWQAGASAQREALRGERQRTDLVELRAVLDEGLVALMSFQSSVLAASTTWWNVERVAVNSTPLPRSSLERPFEVLEAARGGTERIRIRLGPRSKIALLHASTVGDFFAALQLMQLSPPDQAAKDTFFEHWNDGTDRLQELRLSMYEIAETRVVARD
jgi:hypothetical protein